MHLSTLPLALLFSQTLSNPLPAEEVVSFPADLLLTIDDPVYVTSDDINIDFSETVLSNAEPIVPLPETGLLDAETILSRRWVEQLFTRALNGDQAEALRRHNVARRKLNLKYLQWDQSLQTSAAAYAKQLAKSGKLVHSENNKRVNQGENLAFASSTSTIVNPITLGTKGWLSEERNYKNETIPKGDFPKYGHYTQIMWKSTTKVGIATASDGKGGWYTVARYSPPGNVAGQKAY